MQAAATRSRLWRWCAGLALALPALAAPGALLAPLAPWSRPQPRAAEPAPPLPVIAAEVRREALTRTVPAIGTLRAAEAVTVAADATGRVAEILFEDGAEVAAGAPLFRLDVAELRAELAAAQAEAREMRQRLARATRLAGEGFGPRAEAEDMRPRLQAAEAREALALARLDRRTVTAPFAGRLGLRKVSPGALVQPGTELVALVALDPIEVRFAVPEREVARIRPGAPVWATGAALKGKVAEGAVRVVAPVADPALRTVEVAARLPNPSGLLLPGMLLHLRVAAERVDALSVPQGALRAEGASHHVLRVAEGGRVERVAVRPGERGGGRVELADAPGLAPGDLVVVEGALDPREGQRVAVARRQGE